MPLITLIRKDVQLLKDTLFSLLYHIVYALFLLCYLPFAFYQMLTKGKYKESLKQRFLPPLHLFNPSSTSSNKKVWVHAVSVGEVKAVVPLLFALRELWPQTSFVISTTTETGQATAKQMLPFCDLYLYAPLDFSYVIAPVVKKIKPDLVLISENDLWWNFLRHCKQNGASIIVMNGRLSDLSYRRFCRFNGLFKRLTAFVDLFCVQNDGYKQKLQALGIAEERLKICGNTKLDNQCIDKELLVHKKLIEFFNESVSMALAPLVIIGSTHRGEEISLLEAIERGCSMPLRICFVPRHPERFDEVAQLLFQKGYGLHRFSNFSSKKPKEEKPQQVWLLDQMGLLCHAYSLANLAVVGGSFVFGIGGHNIVEPVTEGVAVLFGPDMKGQQELAKMVLGCSAGCQCRNADHAAEVIENYFNDDSFRKQLQSGVQRLQLTMRGATKRTVEAIINVVG